jgi:tetratricopeptide (TPR) repeat protein
MRWLLPSLLICALPVRAEPGVALEARARDHFETGRALYRVGQYEAAAREFAAGYDLVPKPEFLLNMGQAYRELHQGAQARELFLRFLAAAPPDHPRRADVEYLLRQPDLASPAPDLTPRAPPAAAPAPAPLLTPAPTVNERPRSRAALWVTVVLVAATAVAAGAIAIALSVAPQHPVPVLGTVTLQN